MKWFEECVVSSFCLFCYDWNGTKKEKKREKGGVEKKRKEKKTAFR